MPSDADRFRFISDHQLTLHTDGGENGYLVHWCRTSGPGQPPRFCPVLSGATAEEIGGQCDCSVSVDASESRINEDPEFAKRRERLWNELVLLHDVWAQYLYLFTESDERRQMLNACAPWYFGTTQRLMLRGVFLGIARLTDPATMGSHSNLVLSTLLSDSRLARHPGLSDELAQMIHQVKELAAPIRHHRDKDIAHLDEATAVDADNNPLPGLKRSLIGKVIDAMGAIYRLHSLRVRETDSIFTLDAMGSAKTLVGILENSERWRKMREIEERKRWAP